MNCWLLLYKHEHQDYLQHITGHFPEKHKARSDKGNPTIKHNSRKCGTVYFMHVQWQHRSSAENYENIYYSSLHKSLYFIVLNLYSDQPPQAPKNKLFSNSALLFTYAICTKSFFTISHKSSDLGTIKHFCLYLLTTSRITIIVSFEKENILLLWNEWQTVLTSWSPTGSWNLK